MVLSMVSMSWRSTLASCSGEMTKWSLSSVVRGRTEDTGWAAVRGAADGAAPAGAERVVGPAVPDTVDAAGKVNVGAMEDGASMVYGV
eukprot:2435434-Pleurochrysis_carterae.AAC.1